VRRELRAAAEVAKATRTWRAHVEAAASAEAVARAERERADSAAAAARSDSCLAARTAAERLEADVTRRRRQRAAVTAEEQLLAARDASLAAMRAMGAASSALARLRVQLPAAAWAALAAALCARAPEALVDAAAPVLAGPGRRESLAAFNCLAAQALHEQLDARCAAAAAVAAAAAAQALAESRERFAAAEARQRAAAMLEEERQARARKREEPAPAAAASALLASLQRHGLAAAAAVDLRRPDGPRPRLAAPRRRNGAGRGGGAPAAAVRGAASLETLWRELGVAMAADAPPGFFERAAAPPDPARCATCAAPRAICASSNCAKRLPCARGCGSAATEGGGEEDGYRGDCSRCGDPPCATLCARCYDSPPEQEAEEGEFRRCLWSCGVCGGPGSTSFAATGAARRAARPRTTSAASAATARRRTRAAASASRSSARLTRPAMSARRTPTVTTRASA
jgi:hypothetical protein